MSEAEQEESLINTVDLAENGQDTSGWPNQKAAAKAMGVSPRTFRRWVEAGEITRYNTHDGKVVYSPAELNMLGARMGLTEAHVFAQNTGDGVELLPPQAAMAQMLSQAVLQIAQQQKHNEALVKLVVDPTNNALNAVTKTNERLMARLEALEERRDDMVKTVEAGLSKQHERNMLEQMASRDESRKERMMQMFVNHGPKALEHITAGMVNANPTKSRQVNATIQLLNSLDPDMLEQLMQLNVLNEQQAELVMQILRPEGVQENEQPQETETCQDEAPVQAHSSPEPDRSQSQTPQSPTPKTTT